MSGSDTNHDLTELGGAKEGDEIDAFGNQHIADLDGTGGATVAADLSVAQRLEAGFVLAEHLEDKGHSIDEVGVAVASGLGDEVRLNGARVDVDAAAVKEVPPGVGASEAMVDWSRVESIVRHEIGHEDNVRLVPDANDGKEWKSKVVNMKSSIAAV